MKRREFISNFMKQRETLHRREFRDDLYGRAGLAAALAESHREAERLWRKNRHTLRKQVAA